MVGGTPFVQDDRPPSSLTLSSKADTELVFVRLGVDKNRTFLVHGATIARRQLDVSPIGGTLLKT